MNTQQLESFIQVAENLNFARAAQALNVTQSAVSRQIHTLEEELGCKLFYRTTRTVSLTPEGTIFLEHAKQVLEQLQVATSRMQHHSTGGARMLRLGCEEESDLPLLCGILAACREKIQEFHPLLRLLTHRALLGLFFQGELEVVFGFRDSLPLREDVTFTPLQEVPLCCVMRPDHPLAGQTAIDEKTLLTQPLVLCNSYTLPPPAAELQTRMAQHLFPERVQVSDNPRVVRMLVRAGYGCAVLPRPAAGSDGLVYRPLEGVPPLTYGLCTQRSAGTGLLRQFVAIARAVAGTNH